MNSQRLNVTRSNWSLSFASVLVLLVVVGCGRTESPYVDNSQDPMSYARDVKSMILSAAKEARRSREPLDHLSGVVQELQQTDRPREDFAETYDQIAAEVQTLVKLCEQSGGRPRDLGSRLDQIVELAVSLPGELPDELRPR